MEPDLIEKLGTKAFQQHFRPFKAPIIEDPLAIVGFDTEYADEGADLLSVQLSCGDRTSYLPKPRGTRFTLQNLEDHTRDLLGEDWDSLKRIYLISYWSTAELSQIKSKWWLDAKVKRVHSSEVYNVTWTTEDKRVITIYDLWHFFFPKPLSKIAPAFGYRKLDWDRARITREDLKDPAFVEYAMNDPIIAEGIMVKLRETYLRYGVDILATKTPAGASMSVYRSQYMPAPATQKDYSLRRLAMRANKGGIAEAYVTGTFEAPPGDVWQQWDADSLYPNAAIQLRGLPMGREAWEYSDSEPPEAAEGIVRVRFAFPEEELYPSLPVVVPGGGMGYPLSGISYCTLAEARVAQAQGATLEWLDCYHYDPRHADESFIRFMRAMMKEKAAAVARGDEAGRIVTKNICNTGIGKMSQRRRGIDIEEAKKHAAELGLPLEIVMDRGFLLDEKGKQEPGECWFPEWHALILGKARALMLPVIKMASSRVTSTDSLIALRSEAERAGLVGTRVDDSVKVGELGFKLEGIGDRLQVIRQRLYVLDWRELPGWGDGSRKVAHHALHLPSEAAAWMMRSHEPRKYQSKKKATLREAVKGTREFGAFYTRPMTFTPAWGMKRLALPSGSSRPWKTGGEWRTALANE